MAKHYTIDIDGVEYEAVTASAMDQLSALQIVVNYEALFAVKDGSSDQATALSFARINSHDFKTLCELLVKEKVTKEGVPVAANMFTDNIANYALLVGKAAQVNLGGFYELRTDVGGASLEQ